MLERDRGRLPDSARALFELPLHDGKLEKVEQPDHETLRLIVDASAGPRGPRGRFELLFSGVDPTTYRGPTPGDIWLYEEVHLADAGFALHVLLWRSELLVEASSVIVRRVDA